MTKLDTTVIAEDKSLVETEHTEAEARIAEVKSAHDALMRVMNPTGRTRSLEVTEVESVLKRKESEAVGVRTSIAERMKVIDLLTRLEEAKGAMDVLMEGRDYGDLKRLFARSFKVLEDRIAALATGKATLDYAGLVDSSNFCCISDNIRTGGVVLEAVSNSESRDSIDLESLSEIELMLLGHGKMSSDSKTEGPRTPFRPETESPIILDYVRRRIEMVMSILTFSKRAINKEGEIDSHDFYRLCNLISVTFGIEEKMVIKTLGSIMKRTLKKILDERATTAESKTTAETKAETAPMEED